uniref:Uncharacterized protein n=1 Tax=Alexandrium monilatum TaxID=311494 RepID=A0A7S4QB83_9DINO|mmetsp:Transcript_98088/g.302440  ORF Transcript_98088/g.302440 Transcript_98088/m.302440 type:complete len:216 (+) Transcript_98088:82-729(+)
MAPATSCPGQFGPYFWKVMIWAPSFGAWAASVAAQQWRGPCRFEELWVAAAEGFLVTIFTITSLQAPLFAWWSRKVERCMGMPAWVHRCAGLLELGVVGLRLGRSGAGPAAAVFGAAAADGAAARLCGTAHVATCGLMGGALWTWPLGVRVPRGVLPALVVLAASTLASDHWLRLALGPGALERPCWHLAALAALSVGAASARALFEPAVPRQAA